MLNVIMILTQDPPSPSLNDNLSITVDRLIYIPTASKKAVALAAVTVDGDLCHTPNVTYQTT